jgi:hypothetical protein
MDSTLDRVSLRSSSIADRIGAEEITNSLAPSEIEAQETLQADVPAILESVQLMPSS